MPRKEQEVAVLAVEQGLLGQEQLDACLAERRRLLKDGLMVSLRELLLARGLLDAARWEQLAREPEPPAAPGPGETAAEPAGEAGHASEAPRPPDGEVLGGYRIVSELGRGAMGVVYEAVQERLKRRVALKVLPQTQALSGVARERFLREARATASLKHPGIVPIYDIGEERGVHFFAMELVEGRSLKRVLEEETRLDPTQAAQIVEAAAEALHFAHEQGVVHRDVKPDNIILRQDGTVVVTDFGLAMREQDATLTREGTIVGTPLYMSPEQARADGAVVDRRADVYGLGVTLYELVAGRVPFDDSQDTGVLLERVIHHDPPPLRRMAPQAPEPLAAIVEVAMEKEPLRRYPSAGALAEDLGRFLRGEPILARPPTRLTRTLRVLRRRARPLLVGALVGCLVLGLALSLLEVNRRWRADNLVLEAIGHLQAGRRAEARQALAEALDLWPAFAEALFRQAQLLLADGDEGGALAALDAALAEDPRHLEALLLRGVLRRQAGELEAALVDLRRGREAAGPGDPRPLLLEGLVLHGLGSVPEAAERLRGGLALARRTRGTEEPAYREAVLKLGAVELQLGRPRAALGELEEAVRLVPEGVLPRVLLGQALLELGNDAAAVEALSSALRRDPDNLEARELRGRAHARQGLVSEAFQDLSLAIERPRARLARGLLRFETIEFLPVAPRVAFDDAGARQDLEPSLADADLPPAARARAAVALGWLDLARDRGPAAALRRFGQALELDPTCVAAAVGRGLLLLRAGRLDEAGPALEAALALPEGAYPARVGLAELALSRGDAERALTLLDEAIALEPARPSAYGARYRIRLGRDDPGAAEDRARASARRDPAEWSGPAAARGPWCEPLLMAERAAAQGLEAFIASARRPEGYPWSHPLTRAEAWLARALLFDPASLQASARRASVLYLLGQFRQADDAYARAYELDPALVEALLSRAVLQRDLLEREGAATASETLRAAIGRLEADDPRRGPVEGALRFELARALVDLGREREALDELALAARLTPARHCVASLRARLLTRLGLPGAEEAVGVAARLFWQGERDRVRGTLYGLAGDYHRDQDRNAAAEHFLTRAIEADPQHAEAWRLRATVRFRSGPEAIASAFVDSYTATDLEPGYTDEFLDIEARFRRYRPLVYHLESQADQLVAALPDMPAVYFFRGYVRFFLGRLDEAEDGFARAYALSGERSFMALVYRGAVRIRRGDLARAEEDLARAEQLRPGSALVAFWRATRLAAAGQVEQALAELEGLARRGQLSEQQLRDTPELAPLLEDPRLRGLLRREGS